MSDLPRPFPAVIEHDVTRYRHSTKMHECCQGRRQRDPQPEPQREQHVQGKKIHLKNPKTLKRGETLRAKRAAHPPTLRSRDLRAPHGASESAPVVLRRGVFIINKAVPEAGVCSELPLNPYGTRRWKMETASLQVSGLPGSWRKHQCRGVPFSFSATHLKY